MNSAEVLQAPLLPGIDARRRRRRSRGTGSRGWFSVAMQQLIQHRQHQEDQRR